MNDLERSFDELSRDVLDGGGSKPENGADQDSENAPSPIDLEERRNSLADRRLFMFVFSHGI
jgi:hypothetical protein